MVIKSCHQKLPGLWASAGHFPPVDGHQNSRRKRTGRIDWKRQMEEKDGREKSWNKRWLRGRRTTKKFRKPNGWEMEKNMRKWERERGRGRDCEKVNLSRNLKVLLVVREKESKRQREEHREGASWLFSPILLRSTLPIPPSTLHVWLSTVYVEDGDTDTHQQSAIQGAL